MVPTARASAEVGPMVCFGAAGWEPTAAPGVKAPGMNEPGVNEPGAKAPGAKAPGGNTPACGW